MQCNQCMFFLHIHDIRSANMNHTSVVRSLNPSAIHPFTGTFISISYWNITCNYEINWELPMRKCKYHYSISVYRHSSTSIKVKVILVRSLSKPHCCLKLTSDLEVLFTFCLCIRILQIFFIMWSGKMKTGNLQSFLPDWWQLPSNREDWVRIPTASNQDFKITVSTTVRLGASNILLLQRDLFCKTTNCQSLYK